MRLAFPQEKQRQSRNPKRHGGGKAAGVYRSPAPRRSKVRFAPAFFFAKKRHPPASLLLLTAKGHARRACSVVNALATARGRYQPYAEKSKNVDSSSFLCYNAHVDYPERIGNVLGKKKGKAVPPPIPASGFYAAIDGKQKGPYDITRLREMLPDNFISNDTLVWKEGMENWTPAEDAEDLRALFQTEVPPIPASEK